METFKFDPQDINNKLAEEYLTKQNFEFHSIGYEDSNTYVEDRCKNKIYTKNTAHSQVTLISEAARREKFEALSVKLEENVELFAQLEHKIRSIPKHKIIDWDLKLIVKYFQNLSYSSSPVFSSNMTGIYMTAYVELAHIGMSGQIMLTTNSYCDIYADANCFAVCHLFVQLCHEVGLCFVRVSLIEDYVADVYNTIPNIECYAVISQKSDISSGVDILRNTTRQGCWNLTRVYVQESAYEVFTAIFNSIYQLHGKSCEEDTKVVHIKQKCFMAYEFSDKLFLINFTGNPEETKNVNKHVILVEVYRTNKELLSLLNENRPFFLSIWCQDIMEANEIAFGTHTNAVWLNDIFTFDGPAKVSQAYYNAYNVRHCYNFHNNNKIKELENIFHLWQKKNLSERRKAVIKVINEIEKKCPDKKIELNEMIRKIKTEPDTFAYVCNNKMCMGIDKSYDEIIYVQIYSEDSHEMLTLLRSVSDGNGVIYKTQKLSEDYLKLVIHENGIPLFNFNDYCDEVNKIQWSHSLYTTKIVHSHFGTIFAN